MRTYPFDLATLAVASDHLLDKNERERKKGKGTGSSQCPTIGSDTIEFETTYLPVTLLPADTVGRLILLSVVLPLADLLLDDLLGRPRSLLGAGGLLL